MNPWNDTTLTDTERAAALLADMSLDERIAQLGSFWDLPGRPPSDPDVQAAGEADGSAEAQQEEGGDVAPMLSQLTGGEMTLEAFSTHGLGQVTRVFGTDPVSVEEGVADLVESQRTVMAGSPHAVPAMIHEECLTGFTAYGATVYPGAIAWGATWSPRLIKEMATRIGADMHAVGIHQGLSPLLDVVRDYRWGRVEETCGEDPYLVGSLGTAYVQGLQSQGVLATLKHFCGYPASKAGRNHAPVEMGRRVYEDVMLYPFEMAVREGGARSVMNSYSDVDGVPAAGSEELLTHILRERWGFDGIVVSDYMAVIMLLVAHRVVADLEEAAILALSAGMDVELPFTAAFGLLKQAVEEGRIEESLIDRAAQRVLEVKASLGLLDADYDPADHADPSHDLDSAGNRAVARRMAEESVVLLKNDGVLPLAPTARVALVGPTAGDARCLMGCYSFPNHVLDRYPDKGLGIPALTIAEALAAELAGGSVVVEPGVPVLEEDRSGIEAAVAAAREAEVAVVAVGDLPGLFGRGTSGEGCDVVDLRLPGLQGELVEAVLATGTPTVLLVVSGRPYALGAYADRAAAVVQAFLPGSEGAGAVAGVLSGRVNPTGHLPIGIPATPGGQPGTYIAPLTAQFMPGASNLDPTPLYPFGHGLGYSTYELSDLEVSAHEIAPDGNLDVLVAVTNTGERDGAEVVQLYVDDPVAQVTRPTRQLIGFAKIYLEAGQTKWVTFHVHADRFSFTGRRFERIVEPGEEILMVGTSAADLPLRETIRIVGEERVVPEGRVLSTPVDVTCEGRPSLG